MGRPTNRPPDAVIYPATLLGGSLALRREAKRQLFGGVFGHPGDIHAVPMGAYVFAYPYPVPPAPFVEQTLWFRRDDPFLRGATPRYDWYRATWDRGARKFTVTDQLATDENDHQGGFLFGWLKPDPAPPATEAHASDAQRAREATS